MTDQGVVYLVGAGPGDPGLLTTKGLNLLRDADVLIYDRLVDPRLVAEAPETTEIVYARQEPTGRPGDQHQINSLLIEHARLGRKVVRLKGGDPFLFGRGGEEAEALAAAGIRFEVVPGVSSALAVPAYAGIPVTDRRYASSLRILTGNTGESETRQHPADEFPDETVVALMAVRALPKIVEQLRDEGWPDATPVALIERGTSARQRTIRTTLAEAVVAASEGKLAPPAIAVVGGVVDARDRIAWYERRPLFGQRILVTRARSQSSDLRNLLEREGADAVLAPAIAFEDPDDWSEVDRAIDGLDRYRWIVFTSQNGVAHFLRRVWDRGGDTRDLAGKRVAVVGSSSAAVLEVRGIRPDLVSGPTARDLGTALGLELEAADAILYPRGDRGDDAFVEQVHQASPTSSVDATTVYRTVAPTTLRASIADAFRLGIDSMIFASPSAVTNMLGAIDENRRLSQTSIVCIGPATSAAVRDAGLTVTAEAREPTDQGMVDALMSIQVQ
jgi:uroporphyrinogen III methyltransferase/synthase